MPSSTFRTQVASPAALMPWAWDTRKRHQLPFSPLTPGVTSWWRSSFSAASCTCGGLRRASIKSRSDIVPALAKFLTWIHVLKQERALPSELRGCHHSRAMTGDQRQPAGGFFSLSHQASPDLVRLHTMPLPSMEQHWVVAASCDCFKRPATMPCPDQHPPLAMCKHVVRFVQLHPPAKARIFQASGQCKFLTRSKHLPSRLGKDRKFGWDIGSEIQSPFMAW